MRELHAAQLGDAMLFVTGGKSLHIAQVRALMFGLPDMGAKKFSGTHGQAQLRADAAPESLQC